MKHKLLLLTLLMAVGNLYGQTPDTPEVPDFSELTEVTAKTFVGYEDITELYLPNVELVDEYAFWNLHNLERITLGSPDKQANIYFVTMGFRTFNSEEPMTKLKSFVMHQPGWSEFEFATMPKYPYQLTYTPQYVSEASPELSEIVLPQRLQYIKSYSFCNSEALTELTIPPMVAEICSYTFRNCPNLKDVYVQAGMPPYLWGRTFDDGTDRAGITLHVPVGFGDVYRNDSHWSDFGTIVEDENIVCSYTPEDLPMRVTFGKFDKNYTHWTYAVADEETREAALISAHYYIDGFREDGSPIFIGTSTPFSWCEYGPEKSPDPYLSYVKDLNGEVYTVTQIGNHTFSGMEFAPVFTLPETIRYIGRGVCRDHQDLEIVRVNATTPPEVGDEHVFGDKSGLRLEVPEGCGDAYAAAPVWRDFGIITENPDLGRTGAPVIDTGRRIVSRLGIDGRPVPADAAPAGVYIEQYSDGTTVKVCR